VKIALLFFTFPLFLFCSHQNKQTAEQTKSKKIVITSDSCLKWGLDPVNFEITFPENYKSELNTAGGYYLQLTKLKGDTIFHQISIGRASNLETDKLGKYIHDADSIFKNIFKNAGIKYITDFLGTDDFLGQKVQQGRATVIFKNFSNEGFIADGEYSTFMAFQISKTNPKEAIVISILSNKKDKLNSQNNIALENERIINSLILK
jgi:hypothetical protein